MKKIIDVIQFIIIIFLIVFGSFVLYQVLRKITSGSWETENIIISLLVLIIGIVFTISLNQIRFSIDYNYFKREFVNLRTDFYNLAKDFKEHLYNN